MSGSQVTGRIIAFFGSESHGMCVVCVVRWKGKCRGEQSDCMNKHISVKGTNGSV